MHNSSGSQDWLYQKSLVITLILAAVLAHSLTLYIGYLYTFALALLLPAALAFLHGGHAPLVRLRHLVLHLRWWHILWVLVFSSGLVFRVRDVAHIQSNPVDASAGYRLCLMIIVGLVLFRSLASRDSNWVRPLMGGLLLPLTLHALLALISVFWSIAPLWTFYKACEFLIDLVLLAAVLASLQNVRELKSLFDLTWLLLSLMIASIWLGVLTWPELAIKHGVGIVGLQIQGVVPAIASNGAGELGALIAIVAFCRLLTLHEHRQSYFLCFCLASTTLIFSQSRSAFTGFLFGLVLVLFMSKRIGLLVFSIAVSLGLFSTGLGVWLWEVLLRGQSIDQFMSLSGRLAWWTAGWDFFTENPLGAGAYAAARFGVLLQEGATVTSSIHNTWLEVLLGTGVVGLVLLLICFVATWKTLINFRSAEAKSSPVYSLYLESVGALAVLSVRSVFAPHFMWHPAIVFLLVLGFAELVRSKRLSLS